MLKLIPFHPGWITHDKLDLKAIYRRPQLKEDKYGELVQQFDANGVPLWDVTTPLPVKQHNKWIAKGFEYVTLADRVSLVEAAKKGALPGGSVQDYAQDPRTGGPWNARKYQESQAAHETADLTQLAADVHQFGSAAVEAIRRRTDPKFTLPPALRNIVPEAVPVAEGADLAESAEVPPTKSKSKKGEAELVGGFKG